jgi:hypothetical protein
MTETVPHTVIQLCLNKCQILDTALGTCSILPGFEIKGTVSRDLGIF